MPKINTYTDNATIEDVDALLTYDPAGNGATKLTTFARIASWISTKLSALTKKTSIASTDQILMVDGAASPVVTKRIDYDVLAKAIIENYASSSLAGANQAVKTALDSINSTGYMMGRAPSQLQADANLDNFTTPGRYYCLNTATAGTIVNSPVKRGFTLYVEAIGYDWIHQTVRDTSTFDTYERIRSSSTQTWSKWSAVSQHFSLQLTVHAEEILANSNMNSYTTPGTYIVTSDAVAAQITNIPAQNSGRLIVFDTRTPDASRTQSGLRIRQEYYTNEVTTNTYIREWSGSSNSWGSWKKMASVADIDTALAPEPLNTIVSVTSGTITLTKSIANYKELIIQFRAPSNTTYGCTCVRHRNWQDGNFSTTNPYFSVSIPGGYAAFEITNETTITIVHTDAEVRRFFGVK